MYAINLGIPPGSGCCCVDHCFVNYWSAVSLQCIQKVFNPLLFSRSLFSCIVLVFFTWPIHAVKTGFYKLKLRWHMDSDTLLWNLAQLPPTDPRCLYTLTWLHLWSIHLKMCIAVYSRSNSWQCMSEEKSWEGRSYLQSSETASGVIGYKKRFLLHWSSQWAVASIRMTGTARALIGAGSVAKMSSMVTLTEH